MRALFMPPLLKITKKITKNSCNVFDHYWAREGTKIMQDIIMLTK
jgi:hypothetical protein